MLGLHNYCSSLFWDPANESSLYLPGAKSTQQQQTYYRENRSITNVWHFMNKSSCTGSKQQNKIQEAITKY